MADLRLENYKVIGTQRRLINPAVEYKVKILELSSDDQERLRTDNRHIPHPRTEERRSHSFRIPVDHKILWVDHYVFRCPIADCRLLSGACISW